MAAPVTAEGDALSTVVIVLDASALIGWAESADVHHAAAVEKLVAHVDDELVVNPLTLAEFYVMPARHGVLDVAIEQIADLGVRTVPLPVDAPARLAGLRAATGLKLPDCCVLLTAEQSAAALLTFDDRLAAAARAGGIRVVE